MDQAWYRNIKPIIDDDNEQQPLPFDNIDSMTIERFYQNYIESKGDLKYRDVILGEWTVNLQKMLLVKSEHPDDTEHHRIVIRGNTHKRRRVDNSKYSSAITVKLPDRELWEYDDPNKGKYAESWLGK